MGTSIDHEHTHTMETKNSTYQKNVDVIDRIINEFEMGESESDESFNAIIVGDEQHAEPSVPSKHISIFNSKAAAKL